MILMQLVVAAIHCPARTQGTPTPGVQLVAGQYLLVVENSTGNAHGMLRLSPGGKGTTGIDLHAVGAQVDTTKGVTVSNGSGSAPTTVVIGGTTGIGLTVYRVTESGFDGTWGHISPKGVSQDGRFCAMRALNRSP